jgi:NAD(P)-dependent dehydrogenase (short-subunit alcohol dehydrogenase family)
MTAPTRPLAVVTGASSGIGLELAREFARHNYDLLIAAENAGIERAADEIRALGTRVDTAQVDLATREGVDALVGRVRADGRPSSGSSRSMSPAWSSSRSTSCGTC